MWSAVKSEIWRHLSQWFFWRCRVVSLAQTIRRKRKVHVPMGRLGERETMSEHDEEEDSYDEEIYETRSGRSGAYSGVGGAMGRRSGRSTGRRDRERERSGSRERSLSPRSDRRSHNLPPRPAKVTLVKSRKNEGEAQNVPANSGTASRFIYRAVGR